MKLNAFDRATPILAITFAALLLTQAALAQETKPATNSATKAATKAPAKSKANLMTRDELRACMDEQDRLQATRVKVGKEETSLDRVKGEIQAADAELQKKAAALDPADEAARKALGDEGEKRDKMADEYNARLGSLRQQAAGYETSRKAWVEKCSGRDFDEMDEAAVKKERQQAARAASKK